MKTFQEFITEAYLIEKTFSSKEEAVKYAKENPPFGGEPYRIKQKSRAGGPPEWRPVRADIRKAQEERREAIKRDLTSSDDMKKGNKKARKLAAAKLEVHHITPLEKSAELKASMSPEQWAERVRRDAEQGTYHGHHHKNLMGTVGPKTPAERRIRTAINHKAAHDLEKEAEDFLPGHVHGKSLLAAGKRRELEKHVGPFQSTLLRREREKEREANK